MANKATMPRKDADIISVAKNAADAWMKETDLKLKWKTIAVFRTEILTFESSFGLKNDATGERSIVSNELTHIRKDVQTGTSHVKNYLAAIYQNNAPAHYASFGITKVGKAYKLPSDLDRLSQALKQMVNSIDKSEFADKPYGKAFWTELKTRLDAALNKSRSLDSTVKTNVISKDEQRANIRKTFNALIALLKANYPDTHKEMQRTWGFQKEKY
jgi:hypothetical protein